VVVAIEVVEVVVVDEAGVLVVVVVVDDGRPGVFVFIVLKCACAWS
jgi:hypothetical protein